MGRGCCFPKEFSRTYAAERIRYAHIYISPSKPISLIERGVPRDSSRECTYFVYIMYIALQADLGGENDLLYSTSFFFLTNANPRPHPCLGGFHPSLGLGLGVGSGLHRQTIAPHRPSSNITVYVVYIYMRFHCCCCHHDTTMLEDNGQKNMFEEHILPVRVSQVVENIISYDIIRIPYIYICVSSI